MKSNTLRRLQSATHEVCKRIIVWAVLLVTVAASRTQADAPALQAALRAAGPNATKFGGALDEPFRLVTSSEGRRLPERLSEEITLASGEQLFTRRLAALTPTRAGAQQGASDPIAGLAAYLQAPQADRPPLGEQPFADQPLSKQQADEAVKLLWKDHTDLITKTRRDELAKGELVLGELRMPFTAKKFGRQPPGGWSLYLSMHGGGGAPPRVNDQQWRNQQRLYEPEEGIYVAPRAPTNTWNLWHEEHIDRFFARLIEGLVVLEGVDANRVYVMGYSAGGDGVYQLAPRMADRWAAAAMMAGHPNDASPLGLRNIGFALYVGGDDAAYQRNAVAKEWGEKLAALRRDDPSGYRHLVTIYPGKGHWMDREDSSALPWMSGQTRDPLPKKIVWKQDDAPHGRFYWLAAAKPTTGALVTAVRDGQTIKLDSDAPQGLRIRLNDDMLDLDQPVEVTLHGETTHNTVAARRVTTIHQTIAERGDPASIFTAQIELPPSK